MGKDKRAPTKCQRAAVKVPPPSDFLDLLVAGEVHTTEHRRFLAGRTAWCPSSAYAVHPRTLHLENHAVQARATSGGAKGVCELQPSGDGKLIYACFAGDPCRPQVAGLEQEQAGEET